MTDDTLENRLNFIMDRIRSEAIEPTIRYLPLQTDLEKNIRSVLIEQLSASDFHCPIEIPSEIAPGIYETKKYFRINSPEGSKIGKGSAMGEVMDYFLQNLNQASSLQQIKSAVPLRKKNMVSNAIRDCGWRLEREKAALRIFTTRTKGTSKYALQKYYPATRYGDIIGDVKYHWNTVQIGDPAIMKERGGPFDLAFRYLLDCVGEDIPESKIVEITNWTDRPYFLRRKILGALSASSFFDLNDNSNGIYHLDLQKGKILPEVLYDSFKVQV
jgi:hypothetical protein